MKLIYIPIEVKFRELISKLFFIGSNLNNNDIFFIGDKMSAKRATNLFGEGIYFYKSINHNDTVHINRIKSKGNIYFSQDVEGGALMNNSYTFQSFLKYRSSSKNVNLVDKIFTWGDFDHKEWKKKYKIFKNKIFKTGEPRTDLWRKDVYNKIFKDEIENLRKYQPYFFIPSSFYSSHSYLMEAIKFDKKLTNKTTSISLKKRIKSKKDSYRNFLKFIQIIIKLAKNYPHYKIIIKPHPSENINSWKKRFNKKYNDKIIIDNRYDLTSYIAGSSCVIFNESTAGIQSIIMGKKTICYDFANTLSFRNYANECVPRVQNFENLKNLIDRDNYTNEQSRYLKKLKKRFYLTKKKASNIIFEHFKKIKIKNEILIHFKYLAKFYGLYYLLSDSILYYLINLKEMISRSHIGYQSHKLKIPGGIERKEIEKFFINLGLYKKIKIIQFGRNGYFIHKIKKKEK